jgi:hypothetical protein
MKERETFIDLPLSQVDLVVIPCDKQELCVDAYVNLVPQIMMENGSFVLEPNACAENKNFLPNATRI